MKWSIVADSSCNCVSGEGDCDTTSLFKAPFAIQIGEKQYLDDGNLNIEEFLTHMETTRGACCTACPSPAVYAQLFAQADNTVAITISSALSGSYNSAMLAREMVLATNPEKNICVLDSKSAGSALSLCVEKAREMIANDLPFEDVAVKLENYASEIRTIFALCSFKNLVRNGRMSRIAGFVAGRLKMWGIGIGTKKGTIKIKGKVRGARKAVEEIVKDMAENGFRKGRVVVSHCENHELANRLVKAIQERWQDAEPKTLSTEGLCSFYAERGGLIVAY